MKKIVYVLIFAACLAGAIYWYSRRDEKPLAEQTKAPEIEEVHYHAGFEIYENNQLKHFSDLAHMDIKPCGPDTEVQEHLETEVHLHDGVGNVVHIHGGEATWGMLLEKLGIDLATSPSAVYLQGRPIDDEFKNRIISPYDQAVIVINSPWPHNVLIDESLQRITTDFIKEIEEKGESCSK